MTHLMTQSEYAAHRGVTPAAVSIWKKAGRLVMAGRKVRVAESDALIAQTEDPNRADVKERHAKERAAKKNGKGKGTTKTTKKTNGTQPPSEPPTPPDDDLPGVDAVSRETFQAARARKEALLADKAEIEVARLRGELIDRAAVEIAAADAFTTFANSMKQGPVIWAPDCYGKSVEQIERILQREVSAVLVDLERKLKQEVHDIADSIADN